jgi:OOP family OmpA-OmpF porin
MTKRFKVRASARYVSEAALAASLLALAGTASAVPGYVTSGDHAVISSSGQCVRTGDWTPDKAREPCDAVAHAAAPAPAPVAEAPAPAPVAEAAPAPVIEKVDLSTDVLFDFDSATLKEGGKKKLDEIAQSAQGADVDRVRIVGHTDRIGSDQYNMDLSQRRAESVKEYLAQSGAAAERVDAEGVGKSDPVTGNECDRLGAPRKANKKLVACLQPDRRVEIELLGQREASSDTSSGANAGSSSGSTSNSTSGR